MKLALLACMVAACIPVYRVDATSANVLAPDDDRIALAMPARDAAQAVVEKLGARGFTVVDARPVESGYFVKLEGNRDFSGTLTLGSVFYVWVDDRNGSSQLRMLGKPTVDHREACPSVDQSACSNQITLSPFGISGAEEALVIHGVLAELRLDGDELTSNTAQAGEPVGDELGHLTLHGCGRP